MKNRSHWFISRWLIFQKKNSFVSFIYLFPTHDSKSSRNTCGGMNVRFFATTSSSLHFLFSFDARWRLIFQQITSSKCLPLQSLQLLSTSTVLLFLFLYVIRALFFFNEIPFEMCMCVCVFGFCQFDFFSFCNFFNASDVPITEKKFSLFSDCELRSLMLGILFFFLEIDFWFVCLVFPVSGWLVVCLYFSLLFLVVSMENNCNYIYCVLEFVWLTVNANDCINVNI